MINPTEGSSPEICTELFKRHFQPSASIQAVDHAQSIGVWEQLKSETLETLNLEHLEHIPTTYSHNKIEAANF